MRTQRGATLIEVLIALLVLSVGLLGLAATQMLSMKNSNSGHQRYMATLAAQDMAERMRANPAGVTSGSYYGEVGGDDGTADESEAGSDDCSSGCSAAQLAAMDKREWGQLIETNLPSASGKISSNDDGDITIAVKWKEQHTGKNYGDDAGGLKDAEFEMTVEL